MPGGSSNCFIIGCPDCSRHPFVVGVSLLTHTLVILKYAIKLKPMVAIAPLLSDRRERGMSARYDAVDWIGGFPFEFAKFEVLAAYLEARGFVLDQLTDATAATGAMSWWFGGRGEALGMCGIVGFFRPGGLPVTGAEPVLNKMSAILSHRGPDDSGTWLDAAAGIALGHRRLSILDLSAAGHQPMMSASGRYVIVFNGEIYDHPEMRREIGAAAAAPAWRGHSDTEILLAGFERLGHRSNAAKGPSACSPSRCGTARSAS